MGQVRGDHSKIQRTFEGLGQTPASAGRAERGPSLLPPGLDPENDDGADELARFLGEAQRLPVEARLSLAALIRKEHGQPLPLLVDVAHPPGSERRRRLGDALVRHAGGVATGLSALALETILAQSLVGLGEPAAAAPDAGPKKPRPPEVTRPRASRWGDIAAAVLLPRRRAAAHALGRLEGKVELARVLLSTVVVRGPRSRFELEQAADLLDQALLKVGLARELFASDLAWPRIGSRAGLARREVAELRPVLWQLHHVLSRPARRRAAVRPTPGEIGDIDRAAEVARETLSIVVAMADLLGELHAQAMEGPLTGGDLQVLGLAFAPQASPPQTLWDDEMVDGLLRLRREAGGARRPGRVSLAAKTGPVRGADLLAALRASGFDLAHVDPGQLRPAARYITGAETPDGRQERFLRVVDALRVLARAERSIWSRERMGGRLTLLTGVPARALLRLPEAEVFHCFQEIVRAVNTSPGIAHVKVGRHRLTLATDETGRVVRSSCRKWGLRAQGAGVLYRTAPLALTALRHYSLSAPLGRLLARSLSASESLRQGAVIHLAHLGSDLLRSAAARGSEPTRLQTRLAVASQGLQDVAARAAVVRSFRSAEQAGAEARRSLAAALAAFDPAAIARANKQLEQAEETRRAALREYATGLLRRADPTGARAEIGLRQTTTAGGVPVPASGAPEPQRTPRPSTTGVSLRALVRELRQTRALVERVQQTAAETNALARRPGVPEAIREAAAASASTVEEALARFRQELTEAQDETATEAARIGLERRIIQIFADYQQIHIALAALSAHHLGSAPAAARPNRKSEATEK